MTVGRGFAIVVASSACAGAVGGLIGFVLGRYAPGYYWAVFGSGADPWFNPVQVGTGLGITQGLVAGLIVGSVVVLASARSEARHRAAGPIKTPEDDFGPSRPGRKLLVNVIGILGAVAIVGTVGFIAGAIVTTEGQYRRETFAKIEKIRPVLNDPRFAGVATDYSSAAQVYLVGTVDTEAAYKALEERLRFLFGDEEARFMMNTVEIARKE